MKNALNFEPKVFEVVIIIKTEIYIKALKMFEPYNSLIHI